MVRPVERAQWQLVVQPLVWLMCHILEDEKEEQSEEGTSLTKGGRASRMSEGDQEQSAGGKLIPH